MQVRSRRVEDYKKVQEGDSEYMSFSEFPVKGFLIDCCNLKGIRLFEEADECVILVGKIVLSVGRWGETILISVFRKKIFD